MDKYKSAYFGGGCFWCTEAIFQELNGVYSVISGYAGGTADRPTYEDVSSGRTGHAEVIKIEYDPDVIPYKILLDVFFASHDPTSLNRQGADIGEQYRSAIFYTDDGQKKEIENYIAELQKTDVYGGSVVTQVKPLDKFYPAEEYHQDFYANNPDQPYCQVVINPKLENIRKQFSRFIVSGNNNSTAD